MPTGDDVLCQTCRMESPPYTSCRSIFLYDGKIRDAILKVKFNNKVDIAPILTEYIIEFLKENPGISPFDVIVPVPKGGSRSSANAALEFCKFLGEEMKMPVEEALFRNRKTAPQHTLSLDERWKNVKDAFQVKPEKNISNLKVLLIDDIFTSGATISNCAKALLQGGASEVRALTLSRAIK
jgi:competence protein ComFC